jgi:uncharacterized protein YcbK (DUF882 family)
MDLPILWCHRPNETGFWGVTGRQGNKGWKRRWSLALAAMMALLALVSATAPALAQSGDRTLTFYYTHTRETGTFTFRRNGQFDQKVLAQLNQFLRDWRRNEPAKMDPPLFDLIWEVYRDVGATQPIHIVSAYRSPKTNEMLRAKSSGVAENSQHTRGHAMDFFIPGVPLNRLREAAMKRQVGGVGFYPTSGSPFVHLDTGNVRAWPRMTRAQLAKVFPDGKTLHIPTDGKPLSNEGTRYAQAEWQKCRMVPCGGARVSAPATMLASSEPPMPARPSRTLAQMIFGDDKPAEGTAAAVQTAALAPTQRSVQVVDVSAPIPAMRSTMRAVLVDEVVTATVDASLVAPLPARKSPTMMLATRAPIPGETAVTALAALGGAAGLRTASDGLMAAYAPPMAQDPDAQRALRMIIDRETAAAAAKPRTTPAPSAAPVGIDADAIRTASVGGAALDAFKGLFDTTWSAVSSVGAPTQMSEALAALVDRQRKPQGLAARPIELVPPEIDHVTDTLVHPVLMSDGHFAVLYEAEGYLDKTTELGALTASTRFVPDATPLPISNRFVGNTPQFPVTH